jgi:hypothetical protein
MFFEVMSILGAGGAGGAISRVAAEEILEVRIESMDRLLLRYSELIPAPSSGPHFKQILYSIALFNIIEKLHSMHIDLAPSL